MHDRYRCVRCSNSNQEAKRLVWKYPLHSLRNAGSLCVCHYSLAFQPDFCGEMLVVSGGQFETLVVSGRQLGLTLY